MPSDEAPIDLHAPIDFKSLKGKTAIITGAGSGFGRQMAIEWAKHGAFIILADINEKNGQESCELVRKAAGGSRLHHFVHCDVTSFASQSLLFKRALALSPGGHIDIVVANAGIAESGLGLNFAGSKEDEKAGTKSKPSDPPKPNMATIDINLTGLIYTSHLAYWAFSLPSRTPSATPRLHHLLLLGSMASFSPAPGSPLYNASKHAVLGLFRSLRCPSPFPSPTGTINDPTRTADGGVVHVNLICPYFADTPLLYSHTEKGGDGDIGKYVQLAKVEDVVHAAGRLVTTSGGSGGGGRVLVVATEKIAKGRGKGGIYELTEVRSRL